MGGRVVKTVSLEIDGVRHPVEVVHVEQLDASRSAIKIHTSAKLDRGRSCVIRAEDGRELECVISNFVSIDGNQIIELRCLEDAEFLLDRP